MINVFYSSVSLFLFLTISLFSIEFRDADLSELVGMEFKHNVSKSIWIDASNSKGQQVGWASFKNPDPMIGDPELIVWFWDPESGFQLVASKSELLGAYGFKRAKMPFQFYEFAINEKGEVAGSFLVNQPLGLNNVKYNQYAWLWWSSEEGLHLSDLPSQQETLKGITNDGFVILEHNSSLDFSLKILNIHQENYQQVINFSTSSIVGIEKKLTEMLCRKHGFSPPVILHIRWYPFSLERFDCSYNGLNISGRGSCVAHFIKDKDHTVWHVLMGYEISDTKLKIFINGVNGDRHSGGGIYEGQL